jgi:hypothetical protein
MIPLLVKACSASLQAYSPSAQVKAAAAQVGDRNCNGEKKILYSTNEVIRYIERYSGSYRILYTDIMIDYSGSNHL